MRTITIENPKAVDFIRLKDSLVEGGIKLSREIEKLEDIIAKQNDVERKYTDKDTPEIKNLIEEGDVIEKEMNERMKELEELGNKIMALKLEQIPEDLMKKHYDLRKEKEEKERERNKVALRVQKIKDRLVPLMRKILKPELTEFEDTETVKVAGNKLEVNIFSHLDDWTRKFREAKEKNTPK